MKKYFTINNFNNIIAQTNDYLSNKRLLKKYLNFVVMVMIGCSYFSLVAFKSAKDVKVSNSFFQRMLGKVKLEMEETLTRNLEVLIPNANKLINDDLIEVAKGQFDSSLNMSQGQTNTSSSFSPPPPATIIDVPVGSYIIDMGVEPQTVENGLKPYGLLFTLLDKYSIPSIIAVTDTLTIVEDIVTTITVLTNDTIRDSEIDTTEMQIYTMPTSGAVASFNPDGTINYMPAANFNGLDTIAYIVCDTASTPNTICDTAMVVITISAVNDAPIANNDADSTYEDMFKVVAVQLNDEDVENNVIITTILGSTGGSTSTVINNDSISYLPPFNFVGLDTISYEVCDNGIPVLCDTALLIMNVLELQPVAVDDSTTTILNFGPLVIDWNDNDTIVDNAMLTSFDLTTLEGGTVADNGNGSFTYTAPTGYFGGDAFTYTICDDDVPTPNCSTAAVNINIIEQDQCISGLYQVISDTIKLLDVTATPAAYVTVASPPPATGFNATGYNSKDGLIYGYVKGDSTIYSFNLTTNTFLPVYKHVEGNSNFTGDFDIDGNLYYTNSNRTTLYKLNVATGVRTNITMPSSLGSSDVTFLPGVGGASDLLIGVTNGNQLVEYDITNNTTNKTNLTGPITAESGGFGAAWIVAGINLYVFNNNTGNIYFIDIVTKMSTLQTTSEPNGANDGMSCLFGLDPFDVSKTLDYGDAPDSYGTLETSGGASAITNISFKLGNNNDIDTLALPTINADGDDTDTEGNDDDGVTLNGTSLQGQVVNMRETYTINISAPIGFGYLSAWIDWNGNGQFDNAEAIAIDSVAASKNISIPITIPANASSGVTYARFRLSARVGAGPRGLYSFGEVEDYKIIINSPPVLLANPITVAQDSSATICFPIIDVDTANTFTVTICGVEHGLASYLITNNEICLAYIPDMGYNGTDSICLIVCDNLGACAATIIPITIVPNLAPDPTPAPPIVIPTPLTIPKDSTGTICTPIIDVNEGDTFTATLCTGSPANGSAIPTIIGDELCLNYTPTMNYIGTDEVCVIVCDQTMLCDTVIIGVTIVPIPSSDSLQAPIVIVPPIVTTTDTVRQICGTITDINIADTHTVMISKQPANGLITDALVDNSSNQVCLTFTPNAGYVGTDSTCLVVCDQTGLCDTVKIPIVVLPSVTQLKLRVLLQGAMIGGIDTLMRDDLRQQGFLPLIQPYTNTLNPIRFTQISGGFETTTNTVLSANINTPNAIVDWVFIELRNAQDSSVVFKTLSALVQRDGDIVHAATGGNLFVNGLPPTFYVSIKHRNHLGVMTTTPVPVSKGIACIDFRHSTNPDLYHYGVYDGLEMAAINGKRALWAANSMLDNKVKYDGSVNDRIKIGSNVLTHLDNLGGVLNFNNSFGYLLGDVNLDGKSKYDGGTNDRLLLQNIILTYPLNTQLLNNYNRMLEQIPE